MDHQREILIRQLSEQIALQEQVFLSLHEQTTEISNSPYIEAKDLLLKTNSLLEINFTSLNVLLGKLEQASIEECLATAAGNGGSHKSKPFQVIHDDKRMSKILLDTCAALNRITMSNTLLHTTALALGSNDIASQTLRHLENLAPIIVKIGEVLPQVVTLELQAEIPTVLLTAAQQAIENTKQIWRDSQK